MVQFYYGSYCFFRWSRNWPLFILILSSSVSVVTRLGASRRRYWSSSKKATTLVFSEVSISALGPTKLPLKRIIEAFWPRTIGRSVKLADHLHLLSRHRTFGAIFLSLPKALGGLVLHSTQGRLYHSARGTKEPVS